MPVETIKCRECGSTEVTEYKPGSYVCSHCDAIFKHIRPASGGGAAGCEIDGCGATSLGRCSACGRRFCTTHQARNGPEYFVDWCTECQAEKKRQAESRSAHRREAYWEERRHWDAQAADALSNVSNPVERIIRTISEMKPSCSPGDPGFSTCHPALARVLPPFPANQAIAGWFLAAVKQPPRGGLEEKENWWFWEKRRTRPGWLFVGATRQLKQRFRDSVPSRDNVWILRDGSILYGWDNSPVAASDTFSDEMLMEMARLTDLKPLELPPPPQSDADVIEAARADHVAQHLIESYRRSV